jgi:uncharacterized membrane protein YgdD (TMEM256/DUF423 family)
MGAEEGHESFLGLCPDDVTRNGAPWHALPDPITMNERSEAQGLQSLDDIPPLPSPPATGRCMQSPWTMIGAVFAGLAVGMGAFAAHGLDKVFTEKYAGQTRVVAGETVPLATKFLDDFKTGAEYQMYHALGLLAVGAIAARQPSRMANFAGWCFLLGILLFSGSLYMLTLTGVTKWGMVTPFGGMLFVVGWGALAVASMQHPSP